MVLNILSLHVNLESILIGFTCSLVVMLFVIAQLPKRSVGSNSLFVKEKVIGSLENYYELLYSFMYDNLLPIMIFRRDYDSQNRFELFTKTGQIGLIRTYSMNIDSIHNSESKWFIERESCLLIINDISELNIRVLVVMEKQRYQSLNLRLVSERNIFNNQVVELIAVKENFDFSLDDGMWIDPLVSFIDHMNDDDDFSNDSLD